MTDAEKDSVWRSLPDGFKKEVSRHCKSWNNSLAFESECAVLDYIFGKHNLTATEEEKPRFDLGSKAIVCNGFNRDNIKDGDIVTLFGYDSALGGYNAVLNPIIGTNIPNKHLAPYTEEQEPKNGKPVDFSSSSLQNEISSLSKEDAEELAKCLAEVNNFIERNQASQVDWLAYRMELAKDTLRDVTSCSTPQEMKANELADYVMTTVDGIVERLKGGVK